jgi:hypothetical protein
LADHLTGNPPLPKIAAVIAIPGALGVVRHRQLQGGQFNTTTGK